MTKVDRVAIVGHAGFHRADCAVREDLTSPAASFLDELARGVWQDDPDVSDWPADEQVSDHHKLVHKIRFVCSHGEPERRTDVNYLHSGVWEFKVASKRLAFYDTDGRGTWTPKGKVDHIDNAVQGAMHWWFPEMDEHLRLLNAWPKLGQKARQLDIDEAVAIAEEDVKHDEH